MAPCSNRLRSPPSTSRNHRLRVPPVGRTPREFAQERQARRVYMCRAAVLPAADEGELAAAGCLLFLRPRLRRSPAATSLFNAGASAANAFCPSRTTTARLYHPLVLQARAHTVYTHVRTGPLQGCKKPNTAWEPVTEHASWRLGMEQTHLSARDSARVLATSCHRSSVELGGREHRHSVRCHLPFCPLQLP